jgi:hypothetical protein
MTRRRSSGIGQGLGRLFCFLCHPIGSRHYARQGDLIRHIKTVHALPSRFLCHIDRCPRSIPGDGFSRKDKLVDHLKSLKPGHGLSHQDAVYQASLHNVSQVRTVPQAAAAYPPTPLDVDQGDFVQPTGLNEPSCASSAQRSVLYNTVHAEAAAHDCWRGDSSSRNLAIHSFTSEMTAEHNAYVNVSAQETVNQKDNRFNVNCIGQGTFDSMSLEDTDQTTFDTIFYAEDYPA